MEIPLEGDTEEPETIPENSENVLEKIEEEPNGNEEILEPEENVTEETPEIVEEAPAPKRPRGRPKGSTKPKEEKAPKPPKQAKQVKPKKAPKRVVRYESSDEEDELPEYVRQEVKIPRAQPSQSEMAASMLRLIQDRHMARVQQKNDLYDSWFQQYY